MQGYAGEKKLAGEFGPKINRVPIFAAGGLHLPVSYQLYCLTGFRNALVYDLALPQMDMGDKNSPLNLEPLASSPTASKRPAIKDETITILYVSYIPHARI